MGYYIFVFMQKKITRRSCCNSTTELFWKNCRLMVNSARIVDHGTRMEMTWWRIDADVLLLLFSSFFFLLWSFLIIIIIPRISWYKICNNICFVVIFVVVVEIFKKLHYLHFLLSIQTHTFITLSMNMISTLFYAVCTLFVEFICAWILYWISRKKAQNLIRTLLRGGGLI